MSFRNTVRRVLAIGFVALLGIGLCSALARNAEARGRRGFRSFSRVAPHFGGVNQQNQGGGPRNFLNQGRSGNQQNQGGGGNRALPSFHGGFGNHGGFGGTNATKLNQ